MLTSWLLEWVPGLASFPLLALTLPSHVCHHRDVRNCPQNKLAVGSKERARCHTTWDTGPHFPSARALPPGRASLAQWRLPAAIAMAVRGGASGDRRTDPAAKRFLWCPYQLLPGLPARAAAAFPFLLLWLGPFVDCSGSQRKCPRGPSCWLSETVAARWQHRATDARSSAPPSTLCVWKKKRCSESKHKLLRRRGLSLSRPCSSHLFRLLALPACW